ncbi:heterokaryon incompatibility protein-domain-containing protein [Paraphoma chrysanthemicola]|nr:heterokaryon incompatibility protein-domain-containing protein [Paraphoma chrysanthemicola]
MIVATYAYLELRWSRTAATGQWMDTKSTLREEPLQRIIFIRLWTTFTNTGSTHRVSTAKLQGFPAFLLELLRLEARFTWWQNIILVLCFSFSSQSCLNIILIVDMVTLYCLLLDGAVANSSSQSSRSCLDNLRYTHRYAACALLHLLLSAFLGDPFRPMSALPYVFLIYPITLHITLVAFMLRTTQLSYLNKALEPPSIIYTQTYCAVCLRTVLQGLDKDGKTNEQCLFERKGTHHRTTRSLRRSAKSSCRICAVVWQHRTRISQDFVGFLMFWRPSTSYHLRGLSLGIISEECRTKSENTTQFKLVVREDCEHEGAVVSQFPRDRDAAIAQTRFWFQYCVKNHEACRSLHITKGAGSKVFRPTRLLHIPDDFASEYARLLLHEQSDDDETIAYTTLSHCWGGLNNFKLTSETFQHMMVTGILFRNLPRTYRDAVSITKYLGINYVWIDSLCIVQDDMMDWAREARSMADVYRYSSCNISAVDAKNATEGCLFTYNARLFEAAPIGTRYLVNETDLYPKHPLYERAHGFFKRCSWLEDRSKFAAPKSSGDVRRDSVPWSFLKDYIQRAPSTKDHDIGIAQKCYTLM